MSLNEIERVFNYFGPQVCQDKVRSFLTPNYRVMKAEIGRVVNGMPGLIIIHEYNELIIDAKEFICNFDKIDFQVNVTEWGVMEVTVCANFPNLTYEQIESKHKYRGMDILIHSYDSKIEYKPGNRVVVVLSNITRFPSAPDLAQDIINAYISELLIKQIINHNGDHRTVIDELRISQINMLRAVDLREKMCSLSVVHHTMDS